MFLIYLIFSCFFYSATCNDEYVYKFCVNEYSVYGQICQAVQKGNSLVVCVMVSDSADCALKLQNKTADFGVFTAEEALLATKFVDNDVRVIGQLRNQYLVNESFSFQTTVVVRENFNGGFGALQGMNYCHPGFSDGQQWSDRILKEFENTVIPRSCQNGVGSAEQEISSISSFFKSACRPGDWVLNFDNDEVLKKKFPSMCELCDKGTRCSYNDEAQGSHVAALKCLTKKNGDVAYVALRYVKEYFGLIPEFAHANQSNPNDYHFLCNDGLTKPLSQPCAWIRQPWPLVVASKERAPALLKAIPSFFCSGNSCKGTWQEAFEKLFKDPTYVFLPNENANQTLLDNLREGRSIPREWEGDACHKSVKWCTTNELEYEKCNWMKQAVISQDFKPRLDCVLNSTMWSCFEAIKKKEADIIAIDSDYAFTAEKVFNLTPVMYQDNEVKGNYLIAAIVRADRQDINSLADLKSKRACFPEYNGLAYNTFVVAAENKTILPRVCPKIKAVSQFFKDLCLPGALDKDHKDYNATGLNNLCTLCPKKSNETSDCEATSNNKYYGNFGAFSCLIGDNNTAIADVAFVDYRRLTSKQNNKQMKTIKTSDYRIMCANGTLIPFPSSDFDEKCAFSNGIRGQIVTRKQNTKIEQRDITDLLLKMKDKFGASISDFDNTIRMFGQFKDKKGVLFQDTTIDFVRLHDENHQVDYFNELKSNAFQECHEDAKKSSASTFNLSVSLLIFVTIFVRL